MRILGDLLYDDMATLGLLLCFLGFFFPLSCAREQRRLVC